MVGKPGVVSQVIQNLLVNAIQHAFDGIINGQLTISAKLNKTDDMVRICVVDNGRGINSDVLSKIFDPFVTTNRAKGNTGLGMHFVYQWVTKSLKGSIKVESKLNKGTSFIVSVPLNLLTKKSM